MDDSKYPDSGNPPPQWMADLTERENVQIAHAVEYARHFHSAGVPGHGHLILIANLAKKLDDLEYALRNPLRRAGDQEVA